MTRHTKDVDLFTELDDQEAVRVAISLRRALEQQGLQTRDSPRPTFDHQFVAVDPGSGAECTVEVLADDGRLRPRVQLTSGRCCTRAISPRTRCWPSGVEPA